jgi:hypothetical protein
MPRDRDKWLRRIKEVEREYLAARFAVDSLLARAEVDPAILKRRFDLKDFRHMGERLDGTYVIRLFAEFETALRLYWSAIRSTHPPTRDLLNGVAAQRHIPDECRDGAHQVRDYRNTLVHERDDRVTPIPIKLARGCLCRFVSFVPPTWS